MDIWRITGQHKLEGSSAVQGAKNAALPIIAASLICPAKTYLSNVPVLSDVSAALAILRHLGCRTEQDGNDVYIDSTDITDCRIPIELMKEMRSSVFFLGALAARCRSAEISLPGGCRLGKRPIDMHLESLRKMGAEIAEDGGRIICRARKLRGTEIGLRFPSVGATENIMLAACRAEGRTVIKGAAKEPEIAALQDCLIALGAKVYGAGTDRIVIEGFEAKREARIRIIPDRIAASTLCCACASAGGRLCLEDVIPEHFFAVLRFLKSAGCDIIINDASVVISSDGKLRSPGDISTQPYPGFPTDAQPLLMAALLRSEGRTRITENIFENRFSQISEFVRLGANISSAGTEAEIYGVDSLHGAMLTAADLRGGASLIVAALAADGESVIYDEGHIRRGYESLDVCLNKLGADISLEH